MTEMELRSRDKSPPRTPPSQLSRVVKGKSATARQSRTRPSVQDVFGQSAEDRPVKSADGDHTRNRSNSHDLSWSPNRQRVSVVDNMLMSLDQFSGTMNYYNPDYDTYEEDPAKGTSRYNFATPNGSRSRAQTGSSASTDYSLHAETPPNKTRSHRSNSSQNFQTSLGRIDSVRRKGEDKESKIPEESPRTANAKTSHPRRSSKGSGSSSIDYGRMTAGPYARMSGRRSASFDHGHARPELISAITKPTFLPSSASEQASAFYESLDAAPMPAIPGGPRRADSPARGSTSGARPDSSMSSSKVPPKKNDVARSGMGFMYRSERSVSPDTRADEIDRPGNVRQYSNQEKRSGLGVDGEPAASQMYAADTWGGSAPASAAPIKEKEKQGFFRRVFGSGRGSSSPADQLGQGGKRGGVENPVIVNARIIDASSSPTPGQQPALHGQAKESVRGKKAEKSKEQPSLNKKPSFFRRRKKSISETVPTPEPLPQLHSKWRDAAARPESASSLRNALDPYLMYDRQIDAEPKSQPRKIRDDQARDSISGTPNRPSIRPVNGAQHSDMVVRDSPNSKHRSKNSKDLKITTDAKTLFGHAQDSRAPLVGKSSNTHARHPSDPDKSLPGVPPSHKGKENAKAASSEAVTSRSGSDRVTTKKRNSEVGGEKLQRLWLLPNDSNEEIQMPPRAPNSTPAPPKVQEATPKKSTSDESDYKTAESETHSPVQASAPADLVPETRVHEMPGSTVDPSQVRNEDREQATKLLNGELAINFAEAATWLGEEGSDRARVRKAFMELFDWQSMSILAALRSFCRQVKLMAETQQLDRVIDALCQRWCECNPRHGFKATDVVHTICFSVVLLNTDLHIADIESKMTKSQFVKNTMPTIRRVVEDAAPNSFDPKRNSMLPPPRPPPSVPGEHLSVSTPATPANRRPSIPNRRPSHQSEVDSPMVSATPIDGEPTEDCGPLVNFPFSGKQSAWELQVEIVLKNFYNSIRHERLPLQNSASRPPTQSQPSSASLSAMTGGMLRRSNSLVSKAGSEMLPPRGRMMDGRTTNRWSSKPRSKGRLYPSSIARSSRTSFDDDMSAISPSASSMWSRASFSKTGTSMSVHSMSSTFPSNDYKQSIGFANALSRTIIREEASADGEESLRMKPLLEDESLELAGSPWAKEGIVKHKHHLEAVDKKAKDRNWVECFAVIEKGWMRLFQFNVNSKSLRSKARTKQMTGGVVGGGNWSENAEPLGSYLLRQSIASALPPPGYSKARPHVWALSLPNGAVHLFQAGTPEIVKEFVGSANYWSARMSKEPLVGGVSNVEYGWSDAVINMALIQDNRPPSTVPGPRPSFQSTIRSSIDQSSTARPKLPADRINVSDWAAPAQSMMPSQLMEVDQLKALSTYVKNVEQELKRHNELRAPMQLAFTPRQPNAIKALSNWEKKSAYLLHEIVKFSKYVESLESAQAAAERVYTEREEYEKQKDAVAEALGRGEIPGDSDDMAVA